MLVTSELLKQYAACDDAVALFEELWPRGVFPSYEALQRAEKEGLDTYFLLSLLPVEGSISGRAFCSWCLNRIIHLYQEQDARECLVLLEGLVDGYSIEKMRVLFHKGLSITRKWNRLCQKSPPVMERALMRSLSLGCFAVISYVSIKELAQNVRLVIAQSAVAASKKFLKEDFSKKKPYIVPQKELELVVRYSWHAASELERQAQFNKLSEFLLHWE
jgi:hypothetical protein